jgi:hypothetical protein
MKYHRAGPIQPFLRQLALQVLCSPPRSPERRDRPDNSGKGYPQPEARKREGLRWSISGLGRQGTLASAKGNGSVDGDTGPGIAAWHLSVAATAGISSHGRGERVWLYSGRRRQRVSEAASKSDASQKLQCFRRLADVIASVDAIRRRESILHAMQRMFGGRFPAVVLIVVQRASAPWPDAASGLGRMDNVA